MDANRSSSKDDTTTTTTTIITTTNNKQRQTIIYGQLFVAIIGLGIDWVAVPSSFLTTLNSRKKKDLKFFHINDGVMGGKSSSELNVTSSGYLIFSGTIITKGGGFASCRTLGDDQSLGFGGGEGLSLEQLVLVVKAKGDGQLYKVTLHTADSWSMGIPVWSYDFLTSSVEETYTLPLSNFIASIQGRPVKNAVLDVSKITGIGFSLSLYTADGEPNPNFRDGPFQLDVKWIKEEEINISQ